MIRQPYIGQKARLSEAGKAHIRSQVASQAELEILLNPANSLTIVSVIDIDLGYLDQWGIRVSFRPLNRFDLSTECLDEVEEV